MSKNYSNLGQIGYDDTDAYDFYVNRSGSRSQFDVFLQRHLINQLKLSLQIRMLLQHVNQQVTSATQAVRLVQFVGLFVES